MCQVCQAMGALLCSLPPHPDLSYLIPLFPLFLLPFSSPRPPSLSSFRTFPYADSTPLPALYAPPCGCTLSSLLQRIALHLQT